MHGAAACGRAVQEHNVSRGEESWLCMSEMAVTSCSVITVSFAAAIQSTLCKEGS